MDNNNQNSFTNQDTYSSVYGMNYATFKELQDANIRPYGYEEQASNSLNGVTINNSANKKEKRKLSRSDILGNKAPVAILIVVLLLVSGVLSMFFLKYSRHNCEICGRNRLCTRQKVESITKEKQKVYLCKDCKDFEIKQARCYICSDKKICTRIHITFDSADFGTLDFFNNHDDLACWMCDDCYGEYKQIYTFAGAKVYREKKK